jgi:hypothetical protein
MGTVTASSNQAAAGLAVDGDPGTSWVDTSGSASPAIFTWEAPSDVTINRVVYKAAAIWPIPPLAELAIELLDASDSVLESWREPIATVDEMSFCSASALARKVRLSLTPGQPLVVPVQIAELRIVVAPHTAPLALAAVGPEEPTASASFQGVGDGPGGAFQSKVYGISPDGRVAVGSTETAPGVQEAFRLADGQLELLGAQAAFERTANELTTAVGCTQSDSSFAMAASDQGRVVVGRVCGDYGCAPAQFGRAGPAVIHGPEMAYSKGWMGGGAGDVSPDGDAIFGTYDLLAPFLDSDAVLFRLESSSLEELARASDTYAHPAVGPFSAASADCVGAAVEDSITSEAVTMLAGAGCGPVLGFAKDVSVDGAILAGSAGVPVSEVAVRGLELLGDLPGGAEASGANAISADGAVVVGWGTRALG